MTVLYACLFLKSQGSPCHLTLYLIETPFNAFAKKADPDQTALVRLRAA